MKFSIAKKKKKKLKKNLKDRDCIGAAHKADWTDIIQIETFQSEPHCASFNL